MELALRIFVFVISFVVFAGVFFSLLKKKLNEANSLLWILVAVAALVAGIAPQAVEWCAAVLGISYQPTLVFVVAITFLLLIVYRNSVKISTQDTKIKELAMELSILKSKLREISENPSEKLETTGISQEPALASDEIISGEKLKQDD